MSKSSSTSHRLETFFCLILFILAGGVIAYGYLLRVDIRGGIADSQAVGNGAEVTDADVLTREDLPERLSRSNELERVARAQREEGEWEESVSLLQEALRRQEQINRSFPGSSQANRVRENALRREIEDWQAEPLLREMEALRRRGLSALDQDNFEEARGSLEQALALVERINTDHSRSRHYNPNLRRDVEEELQRAEMAPLLEARAEALRQARRAIEIGDTEDAEIFFTEARDLQEHIMRDHPNHPRAEASILEGMDTERETSLSGTLVEQLEEAFGRMQDAYARGESTEGDRYFQVARENFLTLRRDFPQSQALEAQRLGEMEYLETLATRRASLTAQMEDRLRPVPGEEMVLLYTREVDQRLYEEVMGENPSRQSQPDLPVESVTPLEAEEFARRMSLLLGRTARLPSPVEFRAAVGEPAPEESLAEQAWYFGNSGGASHPVAARSANAQGFYDLLGNVAEWVRAPGGEVQAIGGTYNDGAETLREIPLETHSDGYRSRTIGFRFVVEQVNPPDS